MNQQKLIKMTLDIIKYIGMQMAEVAGLEIEVDSGHYGCLGHGIAGVNLIPLREQVLSTRP